MMGNEDAKNPDVILMKLLYNGLKLQVECMFKSGGSDVE